MGSIPINIKNRGETPTKTKNLNENTWDGFFLNGPRVTEDFMCELNYPSDDAADESTSDAL